jgi:acyl-CoA thioesterase-2
MAPSKRPAHRQVWLRANGKLPDDPALHRYLLAYASDHAFMTTALLPHGVTWLTPGMQIASLDHAMWFHRPFRVDEWLLHVIDSPVARGARGLARGSLFNRAGELVASTAQEGLIRKR